MDNTYTKIQQMPEEIRDGCRTRFLDMWHNKGKKLMDAVSELEDTFSVSYSYGEMEVVSSFERGVGMDESFWTSVDLRLPDSLGDRKVLETIANLKVLAVAIANHKLELD